MPTVAELDAQIARKREQLDELFPVAEPTLAALSGWYDAALCHGSCGLEGNALTREQVVSVLATWLTVGGKTLLDHVQLFDECYALAFVRRHAPREDVLDEGMLRAIHMRAMRRCDPGAGLHGNQLRRGPETVGLLPAPEALPGLLAGFARWLAAVPATPAVAFEAHWQLVAMQAFATANNRVARLAMTLLLLRAGFPPVVIEPEARTAYLDALRARREGEVEGYGAFLRERLVRSLDHCIDVLSHSEGAA